MEDGNAQPRCFFIDGSDGTGKTFVYETLYYLMRGRNLKMKNMAYTGTILEVFSGENFVDPETGATTNHVESEWQKFKMENKKRYGTHQKFIVYLHVYGLSF
uniref:ATP-dependent DNA helicase n=1 Tax=Acrobeloides nanus TaxID=290746 RepID=A0A914C0F1_9BILA